MPIYLSKIKNLIIGCLALLAIYQTSQLWFEDSLSRNFFYPFLNLKESGGNSADMDSFAYPYRIVTSFGNNEFDIAYSGMNESDTRTLADSAIELALKSGAFMNVSQMDWQGLLGQRAVIYEYAFEMPADLFVKIFSQKSNILTTRVDFFDSIMIIPDSEAAELLKVYFVNSRQDECFEIQVSNIDVCDELRRTIQNTQKNKDSKNIHYVSSKILRLGSENNLYLPKWGSEGFAYDIGLITVDYYEDAVDKNVIDKNLDSFFDNPSVKWYVGNEIITFSDEYTVVKYYDNDVLEYTNYKKNNSLRTSAVLDDYMAAINFIKNKDVLMTNEYYLSGFKEEEDRRYFYFDFIVSDFPIIYLDSLKTSMGTGTEGSKTTPVLTSGIEVIFEAGNLVSYKKLAYTFETSEADTENATIDFIKYIETEGFEGNELADIHFGYAADVRDRRIENKKSMLLYLEVVTTYDKSFLKSAR